MSRTGRPRSTDIDERIVAVTRALIDEGGIEAVSIAKVAQLAEVGRPTVYRRYRDRTHLARAVLTHDLRQLVESFPATPPSGPIVDRVMGMLEPFMRYYAARPERSRALLKESILNEGAYDDPMNQLTVGWAWRIGEELVRAREAGEIGPEIDLERAVQMIFSTYLVSVLGGLNGFYPSFELQLEALRGCIVQHLRIDP